MKIKEIDDQHKLSEGPLDWLKGKSAAYKGAGTRNSVAKDLYSKWMQSVGMDKTLANNPQALQQFMQKAARNVANVPAPTDMSPGGVSEYITTVTGQSLAAAMRDNPEADSWGARHDASRGGPDTAGDPVKTKFPGLTVQAGHKDPKLEPLLDLNGQKYSINPETGRWVNEIGVPANDNLQSTFYDAMKKYAPNNESAIEGFKKISGIADPNDAQQSTAAVVPGTASAAAPGLSQAQQDYIAAIGTDEPSRIIVPPSTGGQPRSSTAVPATDVAEPPEAPAVPQTPGEKRKADLAAAAAAADAEMKRNPAPATTTPAVPQTPGEKRKADLAAAAAAAQAQMGPPGQPVPRATPTANFRQAGTITPRMKQAIPATVPNTTTTMPTNMPATAVPPKPVVPLQPSKTPRPGLAAAQRRAEQDRFLNQPVAQLESVDLGEVLWRKMKSKRR